MLYIQGCACQISAKEEFESKRIIKENFPMNRLGIGRHHK